MNSRSKFKKGDLVKSINGLLGILLNIETNLGPYEGGKTDCVVYFFRAPRLGGYSYYTDMLEQVTK